FSAAFLAASSRAGLSLIFAIPCCVYRTSVTKFAMIFSIGKRSTQYALPIGGVKFTHGRRSMNDMAIHEQRVGSERLFATIAFQDALAIFPCFSCRRTISIMARAPEIKPPRWPAELTPATKSDRKSVV